MDAYKIACEGDVLMKRRRYDMVTKVERVCHAVTPWRRDLYAPKTTECLDSMEALEDSLNKIGCRLMKNEDSNVFMPLTDSDPGQ